MKIAFVLYDQFTALDLVGPYEVIARWPGAEVHFVATGPDPVRTDAGLVVLPTSPLDSLTAPDLVLVPGSGNPMPALGDKALLAWVRHVSQHATWMASTCTGASIYAAAGLLAGGEPPRTGRSAPSWPRWASTSAQTASSLMNRSSAARASRPVSTWRWR